MNDYLYNNITKNLSLFLSSNLKIEIRMLQDLNDWGKFEKHLIDLVTYAPYEFLMA